MFIKDSMFQFESAIIMSHVARTSTKHFSWHVRHKGQIWINSFVTSLFKVTTCIGLVVEIQNHQILTKSHNFEL